LFVTNLGVSDFIMGVYLLIIVGADIYYRGDYVLHDRSWRASFPCQFAGFLATFSSETSILFVLLITLDRFLVMKFPFGQVKLSKVAKNIATIIIWMIGFLIALSPVVFGFDTYSSNAVCLGLPLTTKWMKGWEFSFAVFIALNLFLCLVIGYSQRAIFRAMSENRIKNNADSNTSTRRPEDLIVAKQLSLVAIASFLCWFPIGFMGLLSVAKYEISNDVFAWTVAIVLPINSAANPILYTIPAVMDKWDKLKNGRRRAVKP
jgi:leucine-rich repeat-containing G protein-coupled receptor 8